jgi:hypothetical protein
MSPSSELGELYDLLNTIRGRVQRLAELQVSFSLSENSDHGEAYRSLSRIERRLTDMVNEAEQRALASL